MLDLNHFSLLEFVFVSVCHQEVSEMSEPIDYPALQMQLFSSTFAQSSAGPSPMIGHVARL